MDEQRRLQQKYLIEEMVVYKTNMGCVFEEGDLVLLNKCASLDYDVYSEVTEDEVYNSIMNTLTYQGSVLEVEYQHPEEDLVLVKAKGMQDSFYVVSIGLDLV